MAENSTVYFRVLSQPPDLRKGKYSTPVPSSLPHEGVEIPNLVYPTHLILPKGKILTNSEKFTERGSRRMKDIKKGCRMINMVGILCI
jgi:hypothetical protein